MTTLTAVARVGRYVVRIVDVAHMRGTVMNICMYRDAPEDWHIKSWPGKPIWTDIPLKMRKGWVKEIPAVLVYQHRYAANKGLVLHKSDSIQMHWDRLWNKILSDNMKRLSKLNGLEDRAIKKDSERWIEEHNKDRDKRLNKE